MIYSYKDTPIFYEAQGQGPALVLLHGFLESSSIWNNIAPLLSENKTVITIDLPGHGKSGVIAQTHSMELLAEVVHNVLVTLEIEKAAFVGHSMGGYVALAYAEKYSNHISSLTLLNSTTYKDNDDRKVQRDRAIRFMEEQKDTIISMAISNLFNETNRISHAGAITLLKEEALLFPSEGIVALIKGMRDRKDRTHILEQFANKKSIVCGNQDPIVSLKDSKEIAKRTHSELTILVGSHMSWLENESEIVKIVLLIE